MTLEPADLLAIHRVYAAYSHAADGGNGEALADLFLPDGTIDFGVGSMSGRDALVGFGRSIPKGAPGIRHFVSNIVVDGAGDAATGLASLVTLLPGPTGPTFGLTGRYEDDFVRTDGAWRIRTRRFIGD